MVKQEYDVNISKRIHVHCPRSEVFQYWRDLKNLPDIMSHLESVDPIDERTSHWVARGPMGVRAEWDAEITSQKENEEIAWQSVEGSEVANKGRVRFEDISADETEISVDLAFKRPAGELGKVSEGLFGPTPESQLEEDLQDFRRMIEDKMS